MAEREKESEIPLFDITDRGYNIKAWYLKDTETEKGDALVYISKNGESVRKFVFPAYKIFNIGAHSRDVVDGEIERSLEGLKIAASDGLGGSVGIKEVK